MFKSPAVLFCTFRCIHDTHRCKCCAGRNGCRDIYHATSGILADCFCKIHNDSAADTNDFITSGLDTLFCIFFCCFIRTGSWIDFKHIFQLFLFHSRYQSFPDCFPCSFSGNDIWLLSKTDNFFSTFFQKMFFLSVSSCAKLDRRI